MVRERPGLIRTRREEGIAVSELNGTVDALARAFRDVIVEAVEPIAQDMREGQTTLVELIGETEKRLEERLGARIDMVATNTNAQFAEIEKRLPG